MKPDNRVVGDAATCVTRITDRLVDRDFARLQGIRWQRGFDAEAVRLAMVDEARVVCDALPQDATVDEGAERLADEIGPQLSN